MRSRLTIGTKLTISSAAMLALMTAMGGMSLYNINKLNQELETATQKTARRLQLGAIVDVAGSDMLAGQRGVMLHTYGKDPARVRDAIALFQSAADKWQKAIEEASGLVVTDEGRLIVNRFHDQLTAWRAVFAEICDAASKDQVDKALSIAKDRGLPIYDANTRDAGRFREMQEEILAEQRVRGASIYSFSWWSAVMILGLTAVVGSATLMEVRRSSRSLRASAAQLAKASEQVSSAASQISSSSNALAQGASEQAASIEETSASAEEIAATTSKNAEDANSAAELMNTASRVVEEANHTLEQMEASMRNINASSEKIAAVIKVIDEIAFQTNILALNAAVEAARAGEAGLGFAVVAEEVRNLAQRSAQAAKDTASMIEESIANSTEGRGKLDQVSRAIRGITENATAVKVLIDRLRVSSDEQARGVGQISKAVVQVQQVTQNAASNAEQNAASGEELSSQAATLHKLVVRLEELVGVAEG